MLNVLFLLIIFIKRIFFFNEILNLALKIILIEIVIILELKKVIFFLIKTILIKKHIKIFQNLKKNLKKKLEKMSFSQGETKQSSLDNFQMSSNVLI